MIGVIGDLSLFRKTCEGICRKITEENIGRNIKNTVVLTARIGYNYTICDYNKGDQHVRYI